MRQSIQNKGKRITIAAVALLLGFAFNNKVNAQNYGDQYQDYNNGYDQGYNNDYGDYQVFYNDLAPYGQWYQDPQYGYVWAPYGVGSDFRPYYTNGYWSMTNYGNMWMSNYAWGWAPFHYGRWVLSNFMGWVWIPGREWGPAWVTWRQGGGYYGWAPMGPGVSVSISFGNSYYAPDPWWTFIPCGNLYSRNFYTYYSPRRTTTIIHNTTIINNTYINNGSRTTYVTGPNRTQVETATRQRVNVLDVGTRSRAGAPSVSGNRVNVYRPEVRQVSSTTARNIAPKNVKALDRSVNPQAARNTNNGNRPAANTSGTNRGNIAAPNRINNQPINQTNRVQPNNTSQRIQQQQAEQRKVQQQAQQRQQVQIQRQQAAQQQRQTQIQRQQVQVQRQQAAQQQRQVQVQRQQAAQQQRQVQVQRQQAAQQQRAAQQSREVRSQPAQPQRTERSQPVQRDNSRARGR